FRIGSCCNDKYQRVITLEGSGLGLAIAKQIITLHNGNIAVKSKRGEGTRFTIVFPFTDQ
ncbi:MAG: hypothetical protein K2K54_12080, partial [Lachnospiraceae bacterium]|nr:hypothetical protein [Lachnospiraceae bacterium]